MLDRNSATTNISPLTTRGCRNSCDSSKLNQQNNSTIQLEHLLACQISIVQHNLEFGLECGGLAELIDFKVSHEFLQPPDALSNLNTSTTININPLTFDSHDHQTSHFLISAILPRRTSVLSLSLTRSLPWSPQNSASCRESFAKRSGRLRYFLNPAYINSTQTGSSPSQILTVGKTNDG